MNHNNIPDNKGSFVLRIAALVVACAASWSFSQVALPSGVVVPKEKFVVYIMIGHSNMVGRDPELDTVPDPHAWNFFITDCCQDIPDHTWVPARDCIHMDFAGAGDGPSMHFLKKMAAEFPGYYFGVVNNANSGVQCRANYLKGNGAGSLDLFAEMMQALDLIKGNVTFGGIVCMLGVPEAVNAPESVCRSFSSDIALMVQEFRDTLGLPQLPFLIGSFERDGPAIASQAPYWQIVDSQTNLVPSKVAISGIVPSDSLVYFDRWHYTYASYEIWTQRAVDTIEARHWYPAGAVNAVAPSPHAAHSTGMRHCNAAFLATDALGRRAIALFSAVPNSPTASERLRRILFANTMKMITAY
jgi:hypothetical protein